MLQFYIPEVDKVEQVRDINPLVIHENSFCIFYLQCLWLLLFMIVYFILNKVEDEVDEVNMKVFTELEKKLQDS